MLFQSMSELTGQNSQSRNADTQLHHSCFTYYAGEWMFALKGFDQVRLKVP